MRILPLQPTTTNNTNFRQKSTFSNADFYVRIEGYQKRKVWVNIIKHTADIAVAQILDFKSNFEAVLQSIVSGVQMANSSVNNTPLKKHTGILRAERKGWMHGSEWDGFSLVTKYDTSGKYLPYKDRFDKIAEEPLTNPYDNIGLTEIVKKENWSYMRHGNSKFVNNALDKVGEIYNDLHKNFIQKNPTNNNLPEINEKIAEIRWILAHSTPWERGSDSIANVFIRSLYKAMGIKSFPLKEGISLDLEAYCTNLDKYKKSFASYFDNEPEIVGLSHIV